MEASSQLRLLTCAEGHAPPPLEDHRGNHLYTTYYLSNATCYLSNATYYLSTLLTTYILLHLALLTTCLTQVFFESGT